MHIPFFHPRALNGTAASTTNPNEIPVNREHDIAEGGEFLDDGIRMKDQPLAFVNTLSDRGENGIFSNKNNDGLPDRDSFVSPEEVVQQFKRQGYTENFATDAVSLYSGDLDLRFHPDEFRIDQSYRFNNSCGPDGNPIVYAITSATGVKGTLVDVTGTCALHPDMRQQAAID